ncbi:MAG TPA: 1-(5-phosphoribosyl)-5-[(5-phosphoribosylamino)methylideneamino]imidazole-4-carboxamide isomerase [Bacteroidales bacterium]|nr:1-(5-phosphoribosyl)-5-[(5-phosphoribosylamino)methylideneamino]imidazole-4-carboxamide isomerase [Bacteroidales bacterium]
MIEIIPAIDIIEGKCVRLSQGDYNVKKIYNEDPVKVAKEFEDAGIRRLHLVDLDGAKEKHIVNLPVLEKIVSNTSLQVDFGGGIKSGEDLDAVFDAGASLATIGSVAVTQQALFLSWLSNYGPDKLILGADVRDNYIAVSGWLETTGTRLFDFLDNYTAYGVKNILCTDISRDGMLIGTALELYDDLQKRYKQSKIIASGGVASVNEVEKLNDMGIGGVIIGKALYEGNITLEELKKFL